MVGCFDIVIAGLFGAIFGSFATFIGYRLFNEKHKLIATRSVCCSCGKALKFYDLVPIISFVLLRGKCRFCKKNIPVWHFLAEIATVIGFIVSVAHFNGVNSASILSCVLLWCLITQSIIDIRTMMSSDALHVMELIATIILARLLSRQWLEILAMFFGTIVFFIVLALVMQFFLKKKCLGFGDIKLFAILAILFDLEKMTLFIGLCGALGVAFNIAKLANILFLTKKSKKKLKKMLHSDGFPFIPAISVAFFLAFYILS